MRKVSVTYIDEHGFKRVGSVGMPDDGSIVEIPVESGVREVSSFTVTNAFSVRNVCEDCERCTWNPGPDCGKVEHPHCPRCGHCSGRHAEPPEA